MVFSSDMERHVEIKESNDNVVRQRSVLESLEIRQIRSERLTHSLSPYFAADLAELLD